MGLESVGKPAIWIGTPALWLGFTLFVLAMLALDLGILHRRARELSVREGLLWSAVWIALALSFDVVLWVRFGAEPATQFLAGYLVEKALSVDNLFVFVVIFAYFKVPSALQYRVLFWGVLGALVTRGLFIVLGAALLQAFHWVTYALGALLVVTALKMLIERKGKIHPERNPLLRLVQRFVPVTADYRGGAFFVTEFGRRYATPLLLVLVTIEATDVLFAIDSIPAVFAITTDPFIVFTSNIFAILGLRALYLALAGTIGKLRFLKFGLALVLAFVGLKMLCSGVVPISSGVSLAVVAALIGASVVASLVFPPADSTSETAAAHPAETPAERHEP